MLTLTSDKNQSKCFKFIGADSAPKTTHLISDNTCLISPTNGDCMDTCSFYSEPSLATIIAFGENTESCGSIAYSGNSIYSAGSDSSASVSCCTSSGSFSGGGCSYSC